MDHIVALSDDGEPEGRNLQLLCPYCNRVKGTQGSPGFRMKMTELRAHNVGTGVMVDEREARSRQGNGNVGTRRVFWCPISVVQPDRGQGDPERCPSRPVSRQVDLPGATGRLRKASPVRDGVL